MPRAFLTRDQAHRYAHYNADPKPEDLAEHFQLRATDLELIETCRLEHTKLGMAVQIGTLRYLGTFLADPTAVPAVVVKTMADQLGLRDVGVLEKYLERRNTRFEHAEHIREKLGYREFDGWPVIHLLRFVYARLLSSDERPIALFDASTGYLAQHKIILPGARVLERLIVRVRERVQKRLYHTLAARLNVHQPERLEALLIVPEGDRKSLLERLRVPPTRISSPSLLDALERVETIRALGVSRIDLNDVPEHRLLALSQFAMIAWGQHLAKLGLERRRATLLAFAQQLEKSATDDALDVFDALMGSLGLKGERKRRRERIRTLNDLDQSALVLRDAARIVLDSSVPDARLRAAISNSITNEKLLEAVAKVSELASPAEAEEAETWLNASAVIGKFIIKLIKVVHFEGTPAAKSLLEAMKWLLRTSGKAQHDWGEVPRAFVPARWVSTVFPNGVCERRAFVVCLAHQLQQALKRREVFVVRSSRHGDPRAQLLQGDAWARVRVETSRALGLPLSAGDEIQKLTGELDAAYRTVVKQLDTNPEIRLEEIGGVLTPVVAPLEALPESASFKTLDARAESRLPDLDLPELLLEVNACAGFVDEMRLVSEGQPHAKDLDVSICAVLVAQACNISLRAVASANHPALVLGRLLWVQQNYVRADTLRRANARLVEHHASLALVQRWGGGEVASADGLRFVVPVRSIYTGSNSRYFGAQRGITYYTLTSDQYTMLHSVVVPGTMRDSLYILSTLLEQQTSLRPTEVMSDTAGYSDVVFGLFKLLGYQFSPRLADVKDSRYWRIDRKAHYGDLNGVASTGSTPG